MDLNDEYLRMILALPDEFFEGWEFNDGDRFILINRKKGKIVDYQDGTIGDSVLENGEVGYIWTSGYSGECGFEKYDSELKPIPSQEQLQDLAMKKMNWAPDKLAQMFIFWVERRTNEDEFWTFVSWDVAWLKVYMFIVENKVWNGEAWI